MSEGARERGSDAPGASRRNWRAAAPRVLDRAEPQRKVSRKILWRGSDAPRASRRKENFTNPKKPWKRTQSCSFAATADPAGASEAARPGCALRLARYLASARVRPPALRVAARSGFHHSSQAPGNGRTDRDNRGQPGGRDRRQGVGAASQVIPNPDAERTGAEHEKPIGSSFQEEMRGRELRDILKELRQVCAGGRSHVPHRAAKTTTEKHWQAG